jgi:hypothetical protein
VVQPWLDHLGWLFPDPVERGIVLDYITHLVQRRGQKINWMLVALAQMQGAGRDTLLKPVRDILGVRNVRSIGAEELFGSFNEWELAELVCFSEADSAEHNRWAIYRALKSKVTKPPDTVQVNIKFIRPQEQVKVANYVMFTNDQAAVAMDRGDRRVCVVETPYSLDTVLAYTATGIFKRLHTLYAKPMWMGAFYRWLLDRPISADFDAAGRAPPTAASARMYAASRSGLEVFVEESIENAVGAFTPDLAKLMDLLAAAHLQPGLGNVSPYAMAAALRRAGADALPEFQTKDRKWVRGVWALRDVGRYLAMSPATRREVWERAGLRVVKPPKF